MSEDLAGRRVRLIAISILMIAIILIAGCTILKRGEKQKVAEAKPRIQFELEYPRFITPGLRLRSILMIANTGAKEAENVRVIFRGNRIDFSRESIVLGNMPPFDRRIVNIRLGPKLEVEDGEICNFSVIVEYDGERMIKNYSIQAIRPVLVGINVEGPESMRPGENGTLRIVLENRENVNSTDMLLSFRYQALRSENGTQPIVIGNFSQRHIVVPAGRKLVLNITFELNPILEHYEIPEEAEIEIHALYLGGMEEVHVHRIRIEREEKGG